MKKYEQQRFIGERALFKSSDLELAYCTFADGESPLKESRRLNITGSSFQWKYPLWYCEDVNVAQSDFQTMARAGIWYSRRLSLKDILYEAPKGLRRCDDVVLTRVDMPNAEETLWQCSNVRLTDVTARGNYFAMNSRDMEIDNLRLSGNYSFDGAKNVTLRNSRLLSKDAFWNAENITIYDSFITGEYFGWNSKNITLVNCTVESLQGFCYIENLVLKDCRLLNTNLAFEYSTVDATVSGRIDSVKNPLGGQITAAGIDELIFDDAAVKADRTSINAELPSC